MRAPSGYANSASSRPGALATLMHHKELIWAASRSGFRNASKERAAGSVNRRRTRYFPATRVRTAVIIGPLSDSLPHESVAYHRSERHSQPLLRARSRTSSYPKEKIPSDAGAARLKLSELSHSW
jgi:hypothetical protein